MAEVRLAILLVGGHPAEEGSRMPGGFGVVPGGEALAWRGYLTIDPKIAYIRPIGRLNAGRDLPTTAARRAT